MRNTWYRALAVYTLLAGRAIGSRPADSYALSLETHTLVTVSVNCTVVHGTDAAVLWTLRGWHKVVNTFASRLSIDNLADRVRPAGVLAGIDTTMVMTNGMNRTVFSVSAIAFWLTSCRIGISYEIRGTLAHRIVRRTWHTEC